MAVVKVVPGDNLDDRGLEGEHLLEARVLEGGGGGVPVFGEDVDVWERVSK